MIFVHLDDQNEDIQNAIYKILRFAAKLRPNIVLAEATNNLKKQKYPRKCQEIIRFAQELVEENKGMDEEEKKE